MDLSNLKREIKEYFSTLNDSSESINKEQYAENSASVSIFAGRASEKLIKTAEKDDISGNKIKSIFENFTGADAGSISAANLSGIKKELDKINLLKGKSVSSIVESAIQGALEEEKNINKLSMPLKLYLPELEIEPSEEVYSAAPIKETPVQHKGESDGSTLKELNEQKNVKEKEVKEADAAYNEALNGSSENIKAAKDKTQKAEKNLNTLSEGENFIDTEYSIAAKGAHTAAEHAKKDFEKSKNALRNILSEIPNRKAAVQKDEADLNKLKRALASSEGKDGKAAADLKAKIKAAEERLRKDEFILKALEAAAEFMKYMTAVTKSRAERTEAAEKKIESDYAEQKSDISKKVKDAELSYKNAEDAEEKTADAEEKTAKDVLIQAQNELKIINEKIEKIKNSEEDDNSSASDYDKNLTDEQKNELEKIKENYNNNKKEYKKLSEETGLPAFLIALMQMNKGGDLFISDGGNITISMIKALFKEIQ